MRNYLVIEYRHWHGWFGINVGPRQVSHTASRRALVRRAKRHMRVQP